MPDDENLKGTAPEDIQRAIETLVDQGFSQQEIRSIIEKINQTYFESAGGDKTQEELTQTMNGQNRDDVKIGSDVEIVLKADQSTGTLTRGIVAEILTNSDTHPHGIKVRLQDGQVGRVQNVISGN